MVEPSELQVRRRRRLLAALEESVPALAGECVTDETSLVRSGLVDSLGLLTIASFVEAEMGRSLDAIELDPARDWDTIADVLAFIRNCEAAPE